MAVKVYLGSAPAAHSEMTCPDADAFSVTAGGFLLIQRQHSGEQKDLAVPCGSRAGTGGRFAVSRPVSSESRSAPDI